MNTPSVYCGGQRSPDLAPAGVAAVEAHTYGLYFLIILPVSEGPGKRLPVHNYSTQGAAFFQKKSHSCKVSGLYIRLKDRPVRQITTGRDKCRQGCTSIGKIIHFCICKVDRQLSRPMNLLAGDVGK